MRSAIVELGKMCYALKCGTRCTTVSTDVLPQETPVRANRAGVLYCKKQKNIFQKIEKVLAFYFWLWHNTNYDDAPFVLESSRTRPTKAKCGRLYPINPPRHSVEARACVLSTNSASCGQTVAGGNQRSRRRPKSSQNRESA